MRAARTSTILDRPLHLYSLRWEAYTLETPKRVCVHVAVSFGAIILTPATLGAARVIGVCPLLSLSGALDHWPLLLTCVATRQFYCPGRSHAVGESLHITKLALRHFDFEGGRFRSVSDIAHAEGPARHRRVFITRES